MASILDFLTLDEIKLSDLIANHYQELMIEQRDSIEQFNFTKKNPIYRAVKYACYRLGFIDHDAEQIALAWDNKSKGNFDILHWPKTLEDFQIDISHQNPFPSSPKSMGLYVVAPSAEWVGKLASAGVPTIQLRFKSNDQDLIRKEIQEAIKLSKNHACHLYINDYWKLAIEMNAYGVHLGQDDLMTANVEEIRNANLRLGISTHGYAEMLRAIEYRPSYVALGAIFPTTLKSMETAPQGIHRLKLYADLLKDFPLVAIGGINEDNISEVIKSSIGSVALVRAVIQAENYLQAIEKLKNQISSI